MKPEQKQHIIVEIDSAKRNRNGKLKDLGIPKSTFYRWKKKFDEEGVAGLERMKTPSRIWNKLTEYEERKILEITRKHPEKSCRILAVDITDSQEDFSVSESTVYRLLKKEGLIAPRAIESYPAAKEWHHKTTKVDEIWQCDATNYFIVGWGYYKQITVLDDFSRNVIGWDLKPDETANSISEVVELAIENAKAMGHIQSGEKPTFLSDNGSGFVSEMMSDYLSAHGIRHIFGQPYHPQTQGKIERFNRTIKEGVCLMVYCSPEELKLAISNAIEKYRATPHKSLKNVSPRDVYFDRKEAILEARRIKKELTLRLRKLYNLGNGNMALSNPNLSNS